MSAYIEINLLWKSYYKVKVTYDGFVETSTRIKLGASDAHQPIQR